jgi:hypothetical protein
VGLTNSVTRVTNFVAENVSAELLMWCLSYNLLKMYRHDGPFLMGRTVPSDRAWKVMSAITCQEPANAYLLFVMAIELNGFE